MPQPNTKRIDHNIDIRPNDFRSFRLNQIMNDINEEMSGQGFPELIRSGGLISLITIWDALAKNKKRVEYTFNRTGALLNSVIRETFSEDGGSVVATTTATISRLGTNLIKDINTVTVRT